MPPVTQPSTSQPESIWPSAMSGGYRGDIAPDSPADDAVVLLFVSLDSRSSAPAELSRKRLDHAAFDINRRHRMHTRGRPWVTPCLFGKLTRSRRLSLARYLRLKLQQDLSTYTQTLLTPIRSTTPSAGLKSHCFPSLLNPSYSSSCFPSQSITSTQQKQQHASRQDRPD